MAYAPDSPSDTGEDYDAMETSRERIDRRVAEDLKQSFDAESDDDADDALPTPSPGIVIGEIARSFGTTHGTSGASTEVPSRSEPMPRRKTTSKRSRVTRVPPPTPTQDLELVRPRVRYPPQGGIRPRDMGPLFVVDTPLLTNLANHPSTSVRRCEVFNLTQTLCMISCFFILLSFFLVYAPHLLVLDVVDGLTSTNSWRKLNLSSVPFW